MARRATTRRLNRRITQRIFIAHRGRNGSEDSGSGSGGESVFYVATAPGGTADVQLVLSDGKVATVTAKPNRAWDDFDYAAGVFTAGAGGYRWNGGWVVALPHLRVVALEDFEAEVGGVFTGTGGSGWLQAWTVGIPYRRVIAVDTFESYAEGVFAGSGGSGWNGGFVVVSH